MATITASLERSLENCTLNQGSKRGEVSGGERIRKLSSPSDSSKTYQHQNHEGLTQSSASSSDDNSTFVDLNSNVSLPFHWEQCLDLKTGELYYINWRTGVKAKEDPRTTVGGYNGDYYTEEEDNDDDEEEEESSTYDSEGSSTESSTCYNTRESYRSVKKGIPRPQQQTQQVVTQDSVLVVAGCKSCLMYYMVPKHVDECPKCSGQLLHFAANNPCP